MIPVKTRGSRVANEEKLQVVSSLRDHAAISYQSRALRKCDHRSSWCSLLNSDIDSRMDTQYHPQEEEVATDRSHQQSDMKERRHECQQCGKKFKQGNQLRQHLIIHKPVEEKPFPCPVCDKAFSRSHHLKLHSQTHTRQSPYTCEICGQGCAQDCNLKRHLLTHRTKKILDCDYCDRGFYSEKRLRTHLSRHENENAYPCDRCKKKFSRPENLQKHLEVHIAPKEHICSECNRGFPLESSLKKHLKAHYSEGKSITCEICGRTFKRIGNYINHKDAIHSSRGYKQRKYTRSGSSRNRKIAHQNRGEVPEQETTEGGNREEVPILQELPPNLNIYDAHNTETVEQVRGSLGPEHQGGNDIISRVMREVFCTNT